MARPAASDVLGLGAVAVDDFLYVDEFPAPDTKTRVVEVQRHCGGLTGTALVAAARLGAKCSYAGVLGKDELSRFALETFRREGIDVSRAQLESGAAPVHSHIVVSRQNGTRNIFFNINQVKGAGTHAPKDVVEQSRVLFVDNLGVKGMIQAARRAVRAGVPVVADFESDSDPEFGTLMDLVDHLVLSSEFAQEITAAKSPEKMLSRLWSNRRAVVIITNGAQGCWYLSRDHGKPVHQPAFKVAVVDTTGCGDVFHGAYAFALAKGMPVEERIRLASATAALKATRPGGQAGIPTYNAVKSFLNHE